MRRILVIFLFFSVHSISFAFSAKLPIDGKWIVTDGGKIGEFLQFVGDLGVVHSMRGQAFFKHEFGDQYELIYAHIDKNGKYSRQRLIKGNLKCTIAVVRFENQDKIILRNLPPKKKICDLGILEKEKLPIETPVQVEEQPEASR